MNRCISVLFCFILIHVWYRNCKCSCCFSVFLSVQLRWRHVFCMDSNGEQLVSCAATRLQRSLWRWGKASPQQRSCARRPRNWSRSWRQSELITAGSQASQHNPSKLASKHLWLFQQWIQIALQLMIKELLNKSCFFI